MDYEKEYKDLVDALKSARNDEEKSGYTFKSVIDSILPKLRESEDEDIRKELIEFIKEGKGYCCPSSEKRQKWAHWLEKQKPVDIRFPNYDNIVEKVFGSGNLESWEYDEAKALVALAKEELLNDLQKNQKPVEWSEEDENTRNKIIGSLDALKIYVERNNEFDTERIESNLKELDNEIEWLQDIVPQPKQEWSEEDNKNLNSVKWIIENSENLNKVFETIGSPEYIKKYFIDWLKSLKPRWKPTKEQMEALECSYKSYMDGKERRTLESLYNDLKSL